MNCKVCNSEKIEFFFDYENHLICLECNCIFRSNPFEDNKKTINNSLKQQLGISISKRFWDVVANKYIEYIKAKTDLKINTALDIGSAYGHFVKKLLDNGIDADGIEMDQKHYAKRVTNKVKFGYFDESINLDKKYDLISFAQMIYYLTDPISVLNNAKKFLNHDGLIFITTYNTASPFLKKYPKIIEDSMNVVLSKKNFESLDGFQVVDITNFRADIFLERIKNPTTLNELKNFIKFHFKQPFTESEQGHQSFILLKISH